MEETTVEQKPRWSKKEIWSCVRKIVTTMALAFVGFFLWVYGTIVISFGFINQISMIIFWTLLLISLQIGLNLTMYKVKRRVRNWSFLAALLFLIVLCAIPFFHWVTVDRFKQINDRIQWHEYDPWREGSKVISVTAEEKYQIKGNLPKINGAYALYPVYSGVVKALYPREPIENTRWKYLQTAGSDATFNELLSGEVDLIFSAPPSKQQIADARKRNLTYEITPYAKEAFVFFVNSRNPVENLTSDQIRKIYSGAITDWKQIDPRFRGKIKPFQRNEGSGSQTMLQKIMGSTPIMPPMTEDRLGGMGGIINDVAGYRNYSEAIGFTFRYFSTEMFRNGEIKLLSVDGIAPTLENIRNGTYPFIADCCIITVHPRNEQIRKIVDFMFSPAGKELVEKTGYVSIAP